jgi:hypothetical protein
MFLRTYDADAILVLFEVEIDAIERLICDGLMMEERKRFRNPANETLFLPEIERTGAESYDSEHQSDDDDDENKFDEREPAAIPGTLKPR